MNLGMKMLPVKILIFVLWITLVKTQETTTTPSTRPRCTQSLMVALKSIYEANADAECVSLLTILFTYMKSRLIN